MTNHTNIYNNLITSMGNHSIADLPKESCGIITKNFTYIPCKNISKTPKVSFILDPIAILANQDNIWGFFHSHPYSSDPIPSEHDIESAIFSQFKFIVGFSDNFYIYWLENGLLQFEKFNEHHCTL